MRWDLLAFVLLLLFLLLINWYLGRGDLSLRRFCWKHHKVWVQLQGSWLLVDWLILDLIGPLPPTTPIEIERDFENFFLKHNDHNSKEKRPLKGFRARLTTNYVYNGPNF